MEPGSGEFYDKILLNRSLGYDVCGYLSGQPERSGADATFPYRGTFQDLATLLEEKEIDEVVISLDYDEFPALEEIIDTCEKGRGQVSLLPILYEVSAHQAVHRCGRGFAINQSAPCAAG